MEILIGEDGANLLFCKDGKMYGRQIQLGSLTNCLAPHVERSIGYLPPNTRWVGVAPGGEITLLVVEIPAGFHNLKVKHDSYTFNGFETSISNVPLPTAIIIMKLRRQNLGYRLMETKLVAIKSLTLTGLDEPVFAYPLPNVNTDFRLCWGDVSVNQDYRTLAALEHVSRMFFRGGFNDHLWSKQNLSNKFDWTDIPTVRKVEVYMAKIAKLGCFDSEWLLPTGKKLSELLKF